MGDFDDWMERTLDRAADCQARWDFAGARGVLEQLLRRFPEELTARRMLAEVLRELGELETAVRLAQHLVIRCEREFGPADPQTVQAVAVLAMLRHDQGWLDAAEALYHRVLDTELPEDDPDAEPAIRAIRLTRANLALLQRDRGERRLAGTMLSAAYAVFRREYGADDLDSVRMAAELAAFHREAGELPAARRLFAVAHAGACGRVGDGHPLSRALERELAEVEPAMPAGFMHRFDPAATQPGSLGMPRPAAAARRAVQSRAVVEPIPTPATRREPFSLGRLSALVRRRAGRGMLAGALVAVAAGGLTVGAAVSGWPRDGAPTTTALGLAPQTQPSPSLSVRLRDDGGSLLVNWSGPAVEMVVALSTGGGQPVVLGTVPAGTSEYLVRGVRVGTNYCVVVGPAGPAAMSRAVWACTARGQGS